MNSPNTSSSYIPLSFDATCLIKYKLSDDLLGRVAESGSLRSSSCRSAVWRLVLRCLPYDTREWEVSLSRSRNNYRMLKKKHLIDPYDVKFSQDPQLNNPLDPKENNPWNVLFRDNDLRDIIGKDVARTFPEIEFFQNNEIRKMMADILLIYAKENPFVSYRQGMHEILAPLVFVIYSDNEAFQHAKENDELRALTIQEEDILNCLFCKDYLEKDSYILFCAVMLEVSRWYEEPCQDTPKQPITKEPYMRVQDSVPASRLMEDLVEVGNLLHKIDPTLANHMSALDIPAQLYGIRWFRLLFGREIPLHDLLFLWDVLLIDRPIAPLAKAIFVTLLVQIRHLLLSSDYGGCLQYLMRYPPIADIDSFVKLARHYRNPKKNAKPTIKSNNYEQITVAGSCHPNKIQRPAKSQQTPASNKKKQDLEKEATSSILALSPVIHRVKNSIRDESNKISKTSSPRKPPEKPQPTTKTDNWAYEIQMMEMQVSTLQTRLNEQDILCSQVSKALEIYSEDVRNAKSSEQCAKLAQNLLELSKTLVSTKPQPNSQKTGTKSEPNVTKALIKPSETTPIRQVNEMVDISAKRLQH